MAKVKVNKKTAFVINKLKSGEKRASDFIAKKDSLRDQGVDVDLIENRLIIQGKIEPDIQYKAGLLGPRAFINGREVSLADVDDLLKQLPKEQEAALRDQLFNDILSKEFKAGVNSAILQTQIVTGLIAPATAGKSLIGKVGLGLAESALIGGLEAGRQKFKGKSAKDALTHGLWTGLLNAALLGTGAVSTKIFKLAPKKIGQFFNKLDDASIDELVKNTDIITNPQPLVTDVGEGILKTLKSYATSIKNQFADDLGRASASPDIPINVSSVQESIKKLGLSKKVLFTKLKSAIAREGLDVSDATIQKFVGIKGRAPVIKFGEARQLNSALFDITGGGPTPEIGGGLLGKLNIIKRKLLVNMDVGVPGITETHARFAKASGLIDEVHDVLGYSGKIKEAPLKNVIKQLMGKSTNKTQQANALLKFQELVPDAPFISSLKKSFVKESIEQGSRDLFRGLGITKLGLGGGAGFALGARDSKSFSETLAKGTLGLGIGVGAASLISNPKVLAATIKATGKIPSILRGITTPTRIGAAKGIPGLFEIPEEQ